MMDLNVNSTNKIMTIVYLLPKNRDDDDVAFAAKIIISIVCNTFLMYYQIIL